MITKEKVLADLLNYSSYDNPLDKFYFLKKYYTQGTDQSKFDQEFSSLIYDLQCDQIDAHSISKPFYLIFENEHGFFIAKNKDEALLGNHHYINKVKSLLTISSNFIKMIGRAFPEEDPAQLNLL
jgi:hypothetical protein